MNQDQILTLVVSTKTDIEIKRNHLVTKYNDCLVFFYKSVDKAAPYEIDFTHEDYNDKIKLKRIPKLLDVENLEFFSTFFNGVNYRFKHTDDDLLFKSFSAAFVPVTKAFESKASNLPLPINVPIVAPQQQFKQPFIIENKRKSNQLDFYNDIKAKTYNYNKSNTAPRSKSANSTPQSLKTATLQHQQYNVKTPSSSKHLKVSYSPFLNNGYSYSQNSPSSSSFHPKKQKGILNLGQTCYLASIIQMISNTPAFLNKLLQTQQNILTSRVAIETFNLIREMQYTDVVSPKELKRQISNAGFFHDDNQQDAHEFFTQYLDLLENGSIDVSMFKTSFLNSLKCKCGKLSTNQSNANHITLNFRDDKNNVKSMIEDVFRNEIVEFKCDCGETSAIKFSEFQHLPQVLILHFNRFRTTGEGDLYVCEKRRDAVEIPMELVFGDPMELIENTKSRNCVDVGSKESGSYELHCLVNHYGSTHRRGHYICDVFEKDKASWINFNDDVMSDGYRNVEKDRSREAYLVLYVKRS